MPSQLRKEIIQLLFGENSHNLPNDDKFARFVRTANAGKGTSPLSWWNENCSRFLNIAMMTRQVLAVQAGSAFNESEFSSLGGLFDLESRSLSDESI